MRLFVWLSRLIFQSLFIAGVSLMTTWAIIDLYIDKLFDQFSLQQVETRIRPADLIEHLAGKMNEPLPQPNRESLSNDVEDRNVEHNTDDQRIDDANEHGEDAMDYERPDHRVDESDPANYTPSHGAIPVWGEVEESDAQHDLDDEQDRSESLAMTAEEFNRKKEEMSEEDKMAVFSLLVTKVPQEVLLKLSVLMEDGLTHEELEQIEEMIMDVLSEDEVGQLLQIIDKY